MCERNSVINYLFLKSWMCKSGLSLTGTLNRHGGKQKISFSRKFPFMKSRERLNRLDDDESFENGSNHRWETPKNFSFVVRLAVFFEMRDDKGGNATENRTILRLSYGEWQGSCFSNSNSFQFSLRYRDTDIYAT